MIDVHNISFAYTQSEPIFDDFSLQVEQGALYGLLGPNGAGKTSLISLLTGLHKPSTGQISINGKHYKKHRSTILSSLSVVPQEYAFYNQLTAKENLHFFSGLYANRSNRLQSSEEAIRLTGLEEYKNRRAGTFSGGLKRRLNLAIGLLNKPALLILDEPTVGIDPQSRRFILEAIQELNKQGTTVLYTSHYMNEVEQICNQIAILDHGNILREGSLNELLSDNAGISISAASKIEKSKLDSAFLAFMEKTQLAINENTISCANFPSQDIDKLTSLLKDNQIIITQIDYGRQSLEDLFFDLTKTRLREN